MAPPHYRKYDETIEKLTKDGLNSNEIYITLNYQHRAANLPDVISYATVYRRYKIYLKKYFPWKLQPLPHEELFSKKKKKQEM